MTVSDTPSLSIVVPTCNRRTLLLETISHLSLQTRRDFEIVVVDDASTTAPDEKALRTAADGLPLVLVRHPTRLGGPVAKNTGARQARGEIIAFLDDDDLLHPEFVARVLATFTRHSKIDLLFFGVQPFGANAVAHETACSDALSRVLSSVPGAHLEPGLRLFDRLIGRPLLSGVPMAFQQATLRASFFTVIGGYRPVATQWDSEFAIRAAMHGTTALLEAPLYLWRVAGQSYYTDRDKLVSVCLADVEIKERLKLDFADRGLTSLPDEIRRWFVSASADAHLELSRAYLASNDVRNAARQWAEGLRIDFNVRRVKLGARLLLGAMGARS
jgi:glycosyltransferase involved in cell wall biosynthesis